MFKKFDADEQVSGQAQLKSSATRALRTAVCTQMPRFEPYVDDVVPKKARIFQVRLHNHYQLLCDEAGRVLFLQDRDGRLYPTLRLLHAYPFMLPWVQVDRGAIRHVLRGANVMCPGLTSPGGYVPPELAADQVVAVMAEGKARALAVGRMLLSVAQVLQQNQGVAIENVHVLGDEIWKRERWSASG
ncbi:similar to PUA domain containing RNA binding protein MCT-1 [Cyanidioschyzon merolae strain 10D]|jgi:PUA domain protein|uniref:Similar to PUA domain containing RNA binding protein MCT-1 n=1 Tax=Cyanidioschyzon merolae (strain NIES-3377 / 10D) TaxID=280699 RepID=M1VGN7_CYAM1|nr:similar to PUA domain containing RNA binding protein MCT-1 [Cyanidioschyzon merolae strain 10D]BAM79873.1 similar to PUA domain containing RNA binding protein MCT-1 [Cyanidioschyzon merolae strain 10D]|eukprot:XP_005536159.1 similar to PUA domain containing RNA binding protein MCT-1 [Cyanidioschyzon merolae strain 10D]